MLLPFWTIGIFQGTLLFYWGWIVIYCWPRRISKPLTPQLKMFDPDIDWIGRVLLVAVIFVVSGLLSEVFPVFEHVLFLLLILLILAFNAGLLWCAWRVRRSMQEDTAGPMQWIWGPVAFGVFVRYPMLIFDGFVLGFSLFPGSVGLMIGLAYWGMGT